MSDISELITKWRDFMNSAHIAVEGQASEFDKKFREVEKWYTESTREIEAQYHKDMEPFIKEYNKRLFGDKNE